MKKFIAIVMVMAGWLSADAWGQMGQNMGRAARQVRQNQIQVQQIPLPQGCREEACRSAGVVAASELQNCRRYICGGNFYGESAFDIKCPGTEFAIGEGDNRAVYNICQIRNPRREYSNDPWFDIRFQTAGPSLIIDKPWWLDTEGTASPTLADWILPNLFANGSETSWSPAAREAVAGALNYAVSNIRLAREQGNFEMIGSPGTEFRTYVDYTEQVLYWILHELAPSSYTCPLPFRGLCELVPFLNFVINDQDGSLGETGEMDHIFVDRTNASYDTDPGLLAIQALVTAHEAAHITNHFLGPPFANQFDPESLEFRTNSFFIYEAGTDPVLFYTDETTAQQVGVITYAFLSDEVRAAIPDDPTKPIAEPILNDFLRTYQFELIRRDARGDILRLFPLNDMYAGTFFWNSLGSGFGSDLLRRYISLAAGGSNPVAIGRYINSQAGIKMTYLKQLESLFLGRYGGFRGVLPSRFSFQHSQPSLHHDHIASPLGAGPGTPQNLNVGPPPNRNYRFNNPGNVAGAENDPAYSDPDRSNVLPDCIGTWSAQTGGCRDGMNACWNTFSDEYHTNFRAVGVCARMMDHDVESDCTSSGDNQNCVVERERQRASRERQQQAAREREQSSGSGSRSTSHPNRPCRGTTMGGVYACGTCMWNASAGQYQMVSNACEGRDWNTCCPACSPPTPECLNCSGGWCGTGGTGGGGTATGGGYGGSGGGSGSGGGGSSSESGGGGSGGGGGGSGSGGGSDSGSGNAGGSNGGSGSSSGSGGGGTPTGTAVNGTELCCRFQDYGGYCARCIYNGSTYTQTSDAMTCPNCNMPLEDVGGGGGERYGGTICGGVIPATYYADYDGDTCIDTCGEIWCLNAADCENYLGMLALIAGGECAWLDAFYGNCINPECAPQ